MGVAPLLAAIKGHPTLAKLNLSSNGLTAKSTPGILALLGGTSVGGGGTVAGGRAAAAVGKLPAATAAAAGKPAGGKTGAATGADAGGGGGGGGALRDLTLVGNDELPEAVLEQVANWKTKQWALQHGL